MKFEVLDIPDILNRLTATAMHRQNSLSCRNEVSTSLTSLPFFFLHHGLVDVHVSSPYT